MRLLTLTVIGGLIAGSSIAHAAEGKQGTIEKSKREGSSGGGRESGGGGGAAEEGAIIREDRRLLNEEKPWEVEASIEGHHLWRQNDLGGAAADKNLLFYGFIGRYQVTKEDQIQAYFGFYERFLADPGETGLRADDAFVGYWRLIPLPEDVELRLNARFTIPFSFASQKQGLVTSPSIAARVTRVFFEDLVVNVRTRGTYNIIHTPDDQYALPLTKFTWSFSVDAEYQLPFYKPLSFGAELYNAYHWYYNLQTSGVGFTGSSQFNGATATPDSLGGTGQPIQQTYGGDVFVRYTFPEWNGLKTDIEVAFANGDPTIGYDNRLHDGAGHTYGAFGILGGYRKTAEGFAVLTVVY